MPHVKTVQLDPEVLDVLRRSTIDAQSVRLPEQLDRALYLRVAKALDAAGGKWNRKARAHLFDVDPRITLTLDDGAIVHRQQTFQRFDTPADLADRVVQLADVHPGHMCLEPSAGGGALVDALQRAGATDVTAIDVDELAYRELTAKNGPNRYYVVQGDFLKMSETLVMRTHAKNRGFDRVVMNPPFTKGQDAAHVCHAFGMLRKGGVLVAIVAPASLTKRTKPFAALQELVREHCDLQEDVARGTFADTDVATRIIRLRG